MTLWQFLLLHSILLLASIENRSSTNAFSFHSLFSSHHTHKVEYGSERNNHVFLGILFRSNIGTSQLFSTSSSRTDEIDRIQCKQKINDLLCSAPSNVQTPATLTKDILESIRALEKQESILISQKDLDEDENQVFLKSLSGNWELVWTAQDPNSPESNRLFLSWINPLENQAYSNNPSGNQNASDNSNNADSISSEVRGRSNPILPQNLQDQLENWGILKSTAATVSSENSSLTDDGTSSTSTVPFVRSSQSIDIKKNRVRNVVAFQIQLPSFPLLEQILNQKNSLRGSLTVDISFQPSTDYPKRIDVKFEACRIRIFRKQTQIQTQDEVQKTKTSKQNELLDFNINLGFFGPTGWLYTSYVDEDIRITRGHKGSVFVLSRATSTSNSI